MLCSMFSVFDPGCVLMNSYVQSKWIMLFCLLSLYNWQYFYLTTGPHYFLNNISKITINMIKIYFSYSYKSVVLILMSIFFFILISSEFGMVPYVFTSTSHLSINLSLSLPFWLGGMIYAFSQWKKAVSHFVPLGCPSVLIPFLVVVETFSNLIRPLSLCLRLMSNMMAGHIMMVLIGTMISVMYANPISIVLIFIQSSLILFELGVAIIQAYVFTNLLMMYWHESIS